jgi:argininosuccinate lyase
MKLWEKGIPTDKQIEQFTGNDREFDLVQINMMLWAQLPMQNASQIGLLTTAETESLVTALEEIIVDVEKEIS